MDADKPAEALLEGYPVTIAIPVQWGDQDAFGHVNNTVYYPLVRVGPDRVLPADGAPGDAADRADRADPRVVLVRVSESRSRSPTRFTWGYGSPGSAAPASGSSIGSSAKHSGCSRPKESRRPSSSTTLTIGPIRSRSPSVWPSRRWKDRPSEWRWSAALKRFTNELRTRRRWSGEHDPSVNRSRAVHLITGEGTGVPTEPSIHQRQSKNKTIYII